MITSGRSVTRYSGTVRIVIKYHETLGGNYPGSWYVTQIWRNGSASPPEYIRKTIVLRGSGLRPTDPAAYDRAATLALEHAEPRGAKTNITGDVYIVTRRSV